MFGPLPIRQCVKHFLRLNSGELTLDRIHKHSLTSVRISTRVVRVFASPPPVNLSYSAILGHES